jgi:hypothetical protein
MSFNLIKELGFDFFVREEQLDKVMVDLPGVVLNGSQDKLSFIVHEAWDSFEQVD